MQTWTVPLGTDDAASASGPIDVGRMAVALMRSLGTPDFGRTVLGSVASAIDAGSMCAYRIGRHAAPTRYCSASRESHDRTGSCWNAYRDGIYRADETFDELADRLLDVTGDGACAIAHMTVEDVRYRPHRERIYDHHALLARLTVAGREPNGELLAVNFYHHCSQGYFADRVLARFETVAAPVLAAVRRHHAWVQPSSTMRAIDRIADFEARLASRAPTLTVRERAVCARLLAGMLYSGIADDLGISLPTVKTYRARAFERLGLHFRNQLFALVDERHAPRD